MTGLPDGPDATRARDADRNVAIELIDAAYSDGQLTAWERDDRCAQVLGAETLGVLRTLTRDLQSPAASATRRPRRRIVPIAVAVAAAVVAGVIGFAVVNGDDPEPPPAAEAAPPTSGQPTSPEPTQQSDPPKKKPKQLEYSLTEQGVENLIQLYRREFGTTKGVAFGFHRTRANIARRGASGRVRWWEYVDDHFVDGGYYDERTFERGNIDITDLNLKATFRNLKRVEDRVGIKNPHYLGVSVVVASGQKGAWLVAGSRSNCEADWMTLEGKVEQRGTPCED